MKRAILLSGICLFLNSARANEHEGNTKTVVTKHVKVLVDQDRLTAIDQPNGSPLESRELAPGPRPPPHPMTKVTLYWNSAFLLQPNWHLGAGKPLGYKVDSIVNWDQAHEDTLEAEVEITTILENRTNPDDYVDDTSGPVCLRDIFQMVSLHFVDPIAKDLYMSSANTVYLPAQPGPCEK